MLKKIALLGFVAFILTTTLSAITFRKEVFILLNSFGYDNSKQIAIFNGNTISVPKEDARDFQDDIELASDLQNINPLNEAVLGAKESKPKAKRIEIDLSKQKLYAYEGSKKKMTFLVSTGKWTKTPTGNFRIWTKIKYTLMTGGSKDLGTYYYLPNVPFTMFFYKDFGIHGAYWHNNFGHPMSHGCVNMKPSDAEQLFYWANPPLPKDKNSILTTKENKGTEVIIYGTTPKE